MKLLWHSVAPWCPTGYGQQTALWVPRIASLGHDVAISAYHGLRDAPISWRGHRVYPGGAHPQGADVLPGHARHFGADLIIALTDLWALSRDAQFEGLPLACWMPIDTEPLSAGDGSALTAWNATPIAMTGFGKRQLEAAGFQPLYVPHGIDTAVFGPSEGARQQRDLIDPDAAFLVGINAANAQDGVRKAWREQMQAFARLHARHSDVRLYLHTAKRSPVLDLAQLARELGIVDVVRWPPQYQYRAGLIGSDHLAAVYSAFDLYSGCSYAEGFGLPLVEAQACGTPAVATDFSAMRETCGGWLVPGEPHTLDRHRSQWLRPSVYAIADVYEEAYRRGASYQSRKASAREHALQYDADRVLMQYWKPALEMLEIHPTPSHLQAAGPGSPCPGPAHGRPHVREDRCRIHSTAPGRAG